MTMDANSCGRRFEWLYTLAVNEAKDVLRTEHVFVDPTGRRQRILRYGGIVVGCVLAAYLATVAFGVVTGARVPLTPWPASGPTSAAAPPGHGGSMLRQAPARTAPARRPRPRAAVPAHGTATGGAAPASSPATSAAVASPTPTRPGNGHAYGRTRAPHPKKS